MIEGERVEGKEEGYGLGCDEMVRFFSIRIISCSTTSRSPCAIIALYHNSVPVRYKCRALRRALSIPFPVHYWYFLQSLHLVPS